MNRNLLRLSISLLFVPLFLSLVLAPCFLSIEIASANEISANEIFESENSSKSNSQERDLLDESLSMRSLYIESLNPAQKKLSSDLLHLSNEKYLFHKRTPEISKVSMIKLKQLRLNSSSEPMVSYGEYTENVSSRNHEKVYVYIYLESFANSSILDDYCTVTYRDEDNHIAVAWVPLDSLETIASMPEVRNIQTVVPPLLRQEDLVTKGDSIFRAESLRELYNVNGTGVKIGVLSDGVDNLKQVQTSGALPPDIHILSNKIGGKEGTAMLEIIHRIAPGAELYFHDCGESRLEFNNAFDALVNKGCTIICDDIGWVTEPFFEDGIVASHIRNVIKERDILYVSSAGNSGDSHYQGYFYDRGSGWHDFSGGRGKEKNLQLEIQSRGEVWVFFEWDDKWDKSGNNYDLFLLDNNNSEILESSEVYQNGDDLPLEYIMYKNKEKGTLNASIQVQKISGEARELEIFVYCWSGVTVKPENLVAKDSIFGHPALPGVVTVGAVSYNESGTYNIEKFSSLGPATVAYPVREIRLKADLSGVDGANITGLGGFTNQLYGTSASAPLVAAVAGLILSAFPDKSEMDIKRLLYTSSVDIGEPGYDTVFGYGLIDAPGMYERAARGPTTFIVSGNGSGDFLSLADAINESNPGDIILVYPGIYRENVLIPWALSISSASGTPDGTILEAASSEDPVFHVTGNSVNIRGFNIEGFYNTSGIYLDSASNCALENNLISGCNQGILLEGTHNNTVILNSLSNNTEGLKLTASFLNRIEKNEFTNNTINEINVSEIINYEANNSEVDNTKANNSEANNSETSNQ